MTDKNFKTDEHGQYEMGAHSATLPIEERLCFTSPLLVHESLASEQQNNLAMNLQ
jgi:hypothetical protein